MENDIILDMIIEDSSKETCIRKLPYLIAKEQKLALLLEEQKIVKKQIELATNIIGAYENVYFQIVEKESKKTIVRASDFAKVFNELKQEKDLNDNQRGLLNVLETDLEEERKKAQLTNIQKRMKTLAQICPEKANNITEYEITKKLVLTKKKSILEDLEETILGKQDIEEEAVS